MRIIKLLIAVPFFVPGSVWLTNLDTAEQQAKKEHKFILLNFSGSDWCGPCIRMHEEILESDAFSELASDKLVMVNADFPRLKKNQLPKSQQKLNDEMAERYNPKGYFPFTLLLDAEGNVIRSWQGFYEQGAANFTEEVKTLIQTKSN